jgi:phenylacetate-coenzyme A ligase PaaK-like adenylate-forming protein
MMSTSSEMRTPEMTERLVEAFGVHPFDLYATTEGVWGVECERHEGIHLFEDVTLVENVDADGNPIPDGEPGAKLLVTNLYNHFGVVTRDREVREFQVIQEGASVLIQVVPRRGASDELESRLRDAVSRRLAELGVDEPRVVVERREELPRSAGGKLQLVVADPAVSQAHSGPR